MKSLIRTILAGGLAMLALSAVTATAAQASTTEGPFYKVGETRLAQGQTKEVTAQGVGNYVLGTSSFFQVTCSGMKYAPGAKIAGSTGANPGTGEETIEWSGCTVAKNGTSCRVSGEAIKTNPLDSRLGYATKTRTGRILAVITPVSHKTLFTIKFVGTCTFPEAVVEGQLIQSASSGGQEVEVGKEPGPATSEISRFGAYEAWTEQEGTLTEAGPAHSVWDGIAVTFTGESELKLAGGSPWGLFT